MVKYDEDTELEPGQQQVICFNGTKRKNLQGVVPSKKRWWVMRYNPKRKTLHHYKPPFGNLQGNRLLVVKPLEYDDGIYFIGCGDHKTGRRIWIRVTQNRVRVIRPPELERTSHETDNNSHTDIPVDRRYTRSDDMC